LLSEEQRSIFYELLAQQKIDGKTISELAGEDKEKALWAIKQFIKSFLE
jgi:hypothetical protein